MQRPVIHSAIPKRRYRLGEFTIVILGEIESDRSNQYQYIMAVVKEGEHEPGLYLVVERKPDSDSQTEDYDLRLIMEDGSEVVDTSSAWRDIENFTSEGVKMVQTFLDLKDEELRRLM